MRPKLVIWGTSGHARVVADVARCAGEFELAGFLDDVFPDRHGSTVFGATVLGGREQLERLADQGVQHLALGFGNCEARLRLGALVRERGYRLATLVHPRAIVAGDAQLGDGTVVVAGAVINPGAVIGANVIVNTSASVDHDCALDDGCHIAPGARLAGSVTVGRASWIGIGAVVAERRRIGADTLVGAGAVVVRDLPDGVVAYGVPARIVRRNTDDG